MKDCKSGYEDPASWQRINVEERLRGRGTVFAVLFGPPPSDAAPSPPYIICAADTGRISVYQVADLLRGDNAGAALCLQAHKGAAYSLSFYGQGSELLLVSGGDDGRIVGWRWAHIEQAVLQGGGAAPAAAVELRCPQTAGAFGAIGPIPEVNSVASDSSHGRLLSGGGDGVCYSWDLQKGCHVSAMKPPHAAGDEAIYAVAARSSQGQAVAGGEEGVVRVWDVRSAKCTSALDPWRGVQLAPSATASTTAGALPWVGCLAMDAEENWLVCGTGGCTASVWSLAAGAATAIVPTAAPPQALHISARDRHVTVAGAQRSVDTYTLQGVVLQSMEGSPDSVYALAAYPGDGMTAIGGGPLASVDLMSQLGSCIASVQCR